MATTSKLIFSITFGYICTGLAHPPTRIFTYQAYTSENTLNANLIIAQRYSGNCFKRSTVNAGRSDAWQCRASNVILDPCFEDGTSLACLISPWTHKAAILDLEEPLHKEVKNLVDRKIHPWALQLANGQRCTYLTGSSTVYDGKRTNYTCESYNYNVIGEIDRPQSTWKVDVYLFDNKSISRMAVLAAWY